MHLRILAVLAMLALTIPLSTATTNHPASDSARLVMMNSFSPRARVATDEGVLPSSATVHLVVGLALHDKNDLDQAIVRSSDPESTSFGKWTTQNQFNDRFAPTPREETAVLDWLEGAGFNLDQRFPNRLIVSVSGTNDNLARATGVSLHRVTAGGHTHEAIVSPPTIPGSLSGIVTGILGLDDIERYQPSIVRPADEAPKKTNPPPGSFAPQQVRAFYGDPPTEDASGETIVIAGAYAWAQSDVQIFDGTFALPALPAGSRQVCTGVGTSPGCAYNASASEEVTADVEYQHGTAPSAIITNYMAASTLLPDFAIAYERIVTDDPGRVISTSWSICDAEVWAIAGLSDAVFANAAALGQTWFSSTGDFGPNSCTAAGAFVAPGAAYPADSPYVTGAGGTSVMGCGETIPVPSFVCPGREGAPGPAAEIPWARGGAMTSLGFEPRPSWQSDCGIPPGSYRAVPDVALVADPFGPGYQLGWHGQVVSGYGGTSFAAPIWAGFFAQLDSHQGGRGLGLSAPRLYQLCGTRVFQPSLFAWNPVTGLGPPNVSALLTDYVASVVGDVPANSTTIPALLGPGPFALPTISVAPPFSCSMASVVHSGDVVQGTATLTTAAWYSLEALSGQLVDVRWAATSESSASVYRPGSQHADAQGTSITPAVPGEIQVRATASGTYCIEASTYTADAFRLAVGVNSRAPDPRLVAP